MVNHAHRSDMVNRNLHIDHCSKVRRKKKKVESAEYSIASAISNVYLCFIVYIFQAIHTSKSLPLACISLYSYRLHFGHLRPCFYLAFLSL